MSKDKEMRMMAGMIRDSERKLNKRRKIPNNLKK